MRVDTGRMSKNQLIEHFCRPYETNIGFVLYGDVQLVAQGRWINLNVVGEHLLRHEHGRVARLKVLPGRRVVLIAKYLFEGYFTISRRLRALAGVEVFGNKLIVNRTWTVLNEQVLVDNKRAARKFGDVRSHLLNINLGMEDEVKYYRVDISGNHDKHAAMFFSQNRLMWVGYDGMPNEEAFNRIYRSMKAKAAVEMRMLMIGTVTSKSVQTDFGKELKDAGSQTEIDIVPGDYPIGDLPPITKYERLMLLVLVTFFWALFVFVAKWMFGGEDVGHERYMNDTVVCPAIDYANY